VSTIALDDVSTQALPEFVSAAKNNVGSHFFQQKLDRPTILFQGVTALLSIGGWTGSQYYSTAVATSENRTAFVSAVLDLVSKYDLDGIDFECVLRFHSLEFICRECSCTNYSWEYPGKVGLPCNVVNPDDSNNFLLFLQELREQPAGKDLVLTTAVGIAPFVGPNQLPMDDVSDFSLVLDRIGRFVLVDNVFLNNGMQQPLWHTMSGDRGLPLSDPTHRWMTPVHLTRKAQRFRQLTHGRQPTFRPTRKVLSFDR
jgi:chitinase